MHLATSTSESSSEDQPLRLLLVRSRPGEMPWLANMIGRTMAPVEIVEIIGFANALWRLGHERYDSVLLDLEIRDAEAMRYCREQIADVAAVPVLNLREQGEERSAAQEKTGHEAEQPEPEQAKSGRKGLRVPWQRRPRRQQEPAPVQVASVG
ncbi:MAG: hypothetical protein AAF637_01475 [Pseudomonadota bacterium]